MWERYEHFIYIYIHRFTYMQEYHIDESYMHKFSLHSLHSLNINMRILSKFWISLFSTNVFNRFHQHIHMCLPSRLQGFFQAPWGHQCASWGPLGMIFGNGFFTQTQGALSLVVMCCVLFSCVVVMIFLFLGWMLTFALIIFFWVSVLEMFLKCKAKRRKKMYCI